MISVFKILVNMAMIFFVSVLTAHCINILFPASELFYFFFVLCVLLIGMYIEYKE